MCLLYDKYVHLSRLVFQPRKRPLVLVEGLYSLSDSHEQERVLNQGMHAQNISKLSLLLNTGILNLAFSLIWPASLYISMSTISSARKLEIAQLQVLSHFVGSSLIMTNT